MTENPILEKIKKLLRMKRGGTPAEIETALSMARKLATEHGIDLDTVDPNEQARSARMTDREGVLASRLSWENKYAALIVQDFFNVSLVFTCDAAGRYVAHFIGAEWQIEIAIHIFRFLTGHFRREWRVRRGRCRNRRSFLYGMYLGLAQKLAEARASEPMQPAGLIHLQSALQEREQYIARNFGPSRTEAAAPDDLNAKAALLRGYRAGQETNIAPAIKPASKPVQGLLW